MQIHPPTVTIAVSAFNEQNNIRHFLHSVINQNQSGYIIKEIIIVNDGSIDSTVDKIKQIEDQRIRLIDDSKNLGKSARLNQIYNEYKTEYLVILDADIILNSSKVIGNLIRPMLEDSAVGMTGGNPVPTPGKTYTERAVNKTVNAYINFKKLFRHGQNPYSPVGRILGFRKALTNQIHHPPGSSGNDIFAYFCCVSKGWKYRYVENATVNFRSPTTIKDQILQNSRFKLSRLKISQHFSPKLVKHHYNYPKTLLFSCLLEEFIKDPVASIYIFLINSYSKIIARINQKSYTKNWNISSTTKKLTDIEL